MRNEPVMERRFEQEGRSYLVQVYHLGGRFVATTRFDDVDVIEVDGPSQEEALSRFYRWLPLAIQTRDLWRP